MAEEKPKITIGRREKVSFPDLGIFDIDAKIDTGAYTTALHCHDIEVKDENGKPVLYFKLLDPSHPEYNKQQQRFVDFKEKDIKNSFGALERRYVLKTRLKIGRKIVKTSISLTDRGNMRFPVLIGRKLLLRRFIVDVNETYLLNTKKSA
ncbi:MAG: ATP-dependent zinc protease [Bacteroidia bacterium]|nr:ATP-dependent zinc protease [Bacteroidia bacterium]